MYQLVFVLCISVLMIAMPSNAFVLAMQYIARTKRKDVDLSFVANFHRFPLSQEFKVLGLRKCFLIDSTCELLTLEGVN